MTLERARYLDLRQASLLRVVLTGAPYTAQRQIQIAVGEQLAGHRKQLTLKALAPVLTDGIPPIGEIPDRGETATTLCAESETGSYRC